MRFHIYVSLSKATKIICGSIFHQQIWLIFWSNRGLFYESEISLCRLSNQRISQVLLLFMAVYGPLPRIKNRSRFIVSLLLLHNPYNYIPPDLYTYRGQHFAIIIL